MMMSKKLKKLENLDAEKEKWEIEDIEPEKDL